MVTGVKTIPRTTKSTSRDAQQEQNRSKDDSRIQLERLRTEIGSDYFRMQQLELRFDLENEQSVTQIHL